MILDEGRVNPTKVLVQEPPKPKEETRASGIIVPKSVTKELSCSGTVVLCGRGTTAKPMEAKVGDYVLFSPHAAQRVFTEDGEFVLLDVADILLYY